jgi:hypothetical protein
LILRGTADDWYVFPYLLAFVAVVYAALYWRPFAQWLAGIRGRNWPSTSAVIDIVSVVEQRQATGRRDIVTYLATLTYSYRNPDLQMGDYVRLFDSDEEADAQAWAASYKGTTVKIHIDPSDPKRSVLRKEDL